MAETTKSNLDLDFSEIAGKQEAVKSIEEVKNPLKAPTKVVTPKLTDTVICIPTDMKNCFISKDLAECTGEEFLRWARAYFPQVTATSDKFGDLATKIRAYEKVKNWHASMLRDKVRDSIN